MPLKAGHLWVRAALQFARVFLSIAKQHVPKMHCVMLTGAPLQSLELEHGQTNGAIKFVELMAGLVPNQQCGSVIVVQPTQAMELQSPFQTEKKTLFFCSTMFKSQCQTMSRCLKAPFKYCTWNPRKVLVWTIFLLKGPARFHVHWWQGK